MAESPLISRAVVESLKGANVRPQDAAGVQLVRRYASLIDRARDTDAEVDVVSDLGPKLLAALTALGLTPAGRGVKGGGQDGGAVGSKLDELRARRQRGAGAD